MKKAKSATRATTTVRIYDDTHYKLRVFAAKQRPKVSLQDVLAAAVDEYLKKHGA